MRHFFYEPRRLIAASVLALLVLSLAGTPSSAAPLLQGTVHKAYISDVRNTTFVVSWVTELPCTGSVTYGTSTDGTGWVTANDTLATPTTTHFRTISGLSPNTTYYFDTISNGVVDDNFGVHYQVTTGPTLGAPAPGITINGIVYASDGTTPVPYAIVYLRVRHLGVDSQLVALRTFSPGGQFSYNLNNLRTADNQSYFPWATGDTITLIGQGGVVGTGQITPPVPSASGSVGNIILNGSPTAVGLSSFDARSPAMNLTLPLVAVALVGALGLLVWRRKQIAQG